MYLKAFSFLYLARTVIVHHVVCAVITEALWKGSKTVRRASWNSHLQPEQHSDQQRAVSCSVASGYSCHIPAGSDKHFHSTSPKTELRGGDYGLEGRKNISRGSRSSFSLVCSAWEVNCLCTCTPSASHRLKVGLLRQRGSLEEETS